MALKLAHELAQKALAVENQDEFWPLMAQRLIKFFGCDRVTIFHRNAKDQLVSKYAHGLTAPVIVKMGEGIAGHAAQTQEHYLANDAYKDPKFSPQIDRLTSYKTDNLLAFPLSYQGKTAGVLELINKPGGFMPEDIATLQDLSSQIAVIFVKFKVEEQHEEMVREMMQVEKMAAVGRMASGVAHEVNNPLSAILAVTQRLLRIAKDRPDIVQNLLKLDAAARRIRLVAENLLGFSRISPAALQRVDLAEIVESSLDLVDHELSHRNVKIVKSFSEAPKLLADANHLKQIFINLIINALQAMDPQGSGKLTFKVYGDPKSGTAVAEVRDTGPGIKPDDLDRIFEPFYTTKAAGKGTGLGLYIVSKIVERYKGRITVESAPDKGVVFQLTFPAAPAGKDA